MSVLYSPAASARLRTCSADALYLTGSEVDCSWPPEQREACESFRPKTRGVFI
jgi:hypothetical protein